jgi:P-type Mg2+ transporter
MINQISNAFWSIPAKELIGTLQSTTNGLTSDEANKRLTSYGANRLKPPRQSDAFTLFIGQFKSPIILILLIATGLSFFLHDTADALIILLIVLVSGLLGFWQEQSKSNSQWESN